MVDRMPVFCHAAACSQLQSCNISVRTSCFSPSRWQSCSTLDRGDPALVLRPLTRDETVQSLRSLRWTLISATSEIFEYGHCRSCVHKSLRDNEHDRLTCGFFQPRRADRRKTPKSTTSDDALVRLVTGFLNRDTTKTIGR